MTRTFWLLVLYGARRLCPLSAFKPTFSMSSMAISSARDCGATYVGESGGRHGERVPGKSVGDCLRGVSDLVRRWRRATWQSYLSL
jgi:hypothetical protein